MKKMKKKNLGKNEKSVFSNLKRQFYNYQNNCLKKYTHSFLDKTKKTQMNNANHG